MAAITTTPVPGDMFRLNNEDIDNGETDKHWLSTPPWARYATIYLTNDVDGGSVQLALHTVIPGEMDDTHEMLYKELAAFTAITDADVTHIVDIGPGVTGIADEVTVSATADSYAAVNAILPPILGIWIIAVGANNAYDLSVVFRR